MKKSIAVLAALLSFSCAAPPSTPSILDHPRAELVARLDEVIQIRFATVTAKDIRKRKLGLGRVAALQTPWSPSHGGSFSAASVEEREALRDLAADGWRADLYLVHERQNADEPGMVVGPVRLTSEIPLWIDPPPAVERVGYEAMGRGPASGAARGATLEARAVRASSALCVKCHDRKSIGDPIAAVVYAFHRAP